MPIKGKSATEILARRIQQARLGGPDGLSQRALGIEMGIPKETASTRVNRYEQGIHAPDAQTLLELAAALNVPPGFLLTADDALAGRMDAFLSSIYRSAGQAQVCLRS